MKIPVAVLGATGLVGQKLVSLLQNHPWFEIQALCASESSKNKTYSECLGFNLGAIGEMRLRGCVTDIPCKLVFSTLSSNVAGQIESDFAKKGYLVVSNAKNHRMRSNIPLLIPEVNGEHIDLLQTSDDKIVTNPNCTTTGLTLALKPLNERFGVEAVTVVSLQSVSGAGRSASFDIDDNVIPFINEEEEKIETETLKLLGVLDSQQIQNASISISAQCNRVAVSVGHLLCVSVKLKQKTDCNDLVETWNSFTGNSLSWNLPSYQKKIIYYFDEPSFPQPKIHRDLGKGMSICIGRLKKCSNFDYKFVVLVNNMIRGAAGGSLLNAELLTFLNL